MKRKSPVSLLTAGVVAVVVSGVVAAVGLTVAQTGSSETWSCDMNAGGEKGQGPTTCGTDNKPRPDWPDCIKFICSPATSGGSGGGSCSNMTSAPAGQWYEWDSATNACVLRGTPSGGSGSGGGGCSSPYPMGGPYNCDAGVFKCYGKNIPDSSRAWEYTCAPDNGGTWTKGTTSGGNCDQWGQATKEYRCCKNPSLGECTSGNMGGCRDSSGFASCSQGVSSSDPRYAECQRTYCQYGSTGETPASCTACITAGGTQMSCPTCPGYTGMGGGTGTSGYGGSYGGGMQWCFYKATRDGKDLGYGVDCPAGDPSSCYKESHNKTNPEREPSAGLTLGSSSSCYWDSNGGYGGTYGMSGVTGGYGGGGSMKRCFYPNAMINGAKAGFTVWCAQDYVDCHKGEPSGESIPLNGLALGAPSSCDSGSVSSDSKKWACEKTCEEQAGSADPMTCKRTKCWGMKDDGMPNCRDKAGYEQCLLENGAKDPAVRMRSCDEKYCWNQGGTDGGVNPLDNCLKGCDNMLQEQQTNMSCKQRTVPSWCTQTVAECRKGCGGGEVSEPERKPVPPEDFCQKYPEDKKCQISKPKTVDGTLEEKLAALEKTIVALEDQIGSLQEKLQSTKDDIADKNDEIRAMKKEKASRTKIDAAKKELKPLKRAASAIVRQGKNLVRTLKFREQEYSRLQRQWSPPPPVIY